MKKMLLPFVLWGVSLLAVSCIKDGPAPYNASCDYYIDVRAFGGNDSQINDVVVYVYDANGKLLGFHRTTAATPINIEQYRPYGVVKVVVWGNTKDNPMAQTLSDPVIGSSITDHTLMQNIRGETFSGNVLTPDLSDIFYSTTDVDFANISGGLDNITTVYAKRAVSSYVLTISDLGRAFDGPNGDYKVIIRHPHNGFDFAGNPIGGESVYMPEATYDPVSDELITSIGIVPPTGPSGMIIEIYSGDNLVHTARVDGFGNMIILESNKLYNILIDMKGETGVEMVVSEWGQVIIFEGFE